MMKHKVFYSWQSDHEAEISSALIRGALVDAIAELGDSFELDEATRGVSGTPDIAATIFAKIDSCSVFVPDLTIVAEYAPGRFTSNPNVLVEHGYALSEIGFERIVPVANLRYGGPEKLPFDVRGKWVGVKYTLDCGADAEARSGVRRQLAKELRSQIQAVVDGAISCGLSQEAIRVVEALITSAETGGDERGMDYADFCTVVGAAGRAALQVADELEGVGLISKSVGIGAPFHHVRPRPKLFWRFDRVFMKWDPERDARLLAARLVAGEGARSQLSIPAVAEELGWEPRRINPAVTYLRDHELVIASNSHADPYVAFSLLENSATRRFAHGA